MEPSGLWLIVILVVVVGGLAWRELRRAKETVAKVRQDCEALAISLGTVARRLEALQREVERLKVAVNGGAQPAADRVPARESAVPAAMASLPAERASAPEALPQPMAPGPAEPAPSTPPVPTTATPTASEPAAPAASQLPASMPAAVTPRVAGVPPERARRVRPPAAGGGERPPSPPAAVKPAFDWEGVVGVKLFSWIAAIALLVATVLFLKYSIDHGWMQPPIRMAIGLVTGIALLLAFELKAARKYPTTANAMDGAAIAVLFATLYAAHALWHLVPMVPAFLFMALVTTVAVVIAVRHDSLFVALLGLVGGFATPVLLAAGEDRTLALFSYLLLLNVGLAWVAYRKKWPVLTLLSVLLTVAHQWAWVVRFFNEDRLVTAVLVFLAFPVAAVAALALGGRRRAREGETDLFERSAILSVGLPLVLAVYLAAVPRFGSNYWLLFGYLFCLAAGMFAIAVWRGPHALHTLGAASTVVVLFLWTSVSYRTAAWPGVLAPIALFVAFYLLAPPLAQRLGRPLAAHTALAAPLLLGLLPLLIAKEPACASPGVVFCALFVLLAACAAYAVKRSAPAVYFVGAAVAVLAEVVWSTKHLTPATLLPALGIYAAFALLFAGVSALSARVRTVDPRRMGGLLLLNASLCLLMFLTDAGVAPVSLAGLGALLILFNLALFREGAGGGPISLVLLGSSLSWVILGTWWFEARGAIEVPSSLAVTALLALVTLAGFVWISMRGGTFSVGETTFPASSGAVLALLGHVFLLGVAASPSLALPPWPILGVLVLLDIAIGVVALLSGRGWLFVAAVALTQLVLLAFELTARVNPWPLLSMISGVGAAALALAWIPLWKRRFPAAEPAATAPLAVGGALAVFLIQLLATVSAALPGAPSLAVLVVFQLGSVTVLLALAWLRGWHVLAPLAVASSCLALFVWDGVQAGVSGGAAMAQERLVFAAALYVPFLLYPLLLGRRVGARLEPHLAAVLASGPFFVMAWRSFSAAGWKGAIGIVPLVQALLLCLLVVGLLRVEPRGRRTQGRLALVAGTALAFITLAIPLQLDKEWITIAWALEAAALAWLFTKVPHRGLLLTSSLLAATVFVRLALNQAALSYYPRSGTPILNWFLYTYLVSAVAMLVAAYFLKRTDDRLRPDLPRSSHLLRVLATVLLFLLLNIEIADAFSTGERLVFRLMGGTLRQDLAYTLGWAGFAICMLAAGVYLRSRAARIASIVLLTVTALKAFLHDLDKLGGLYRVASFVGLAVSLALVAIAIQRFVLSKTTEPKQ